MNDISLAALEKVELRDVWISESQDFTPWLAEESNLDLLAKTLNLDLELVGIEQNVGPFRADILCKEMNSDKRVLIENQLEVSDHVHLGQIITYAAGLDARTVIWVAKKFTEEHRAALEKLNSMSGSDCIHFFAIEIELWKIGNSNPAPRFNVVVQPNDWSSQVAEATRKIEMVDLSETKKLQFEYWNQLNERLKDDKTIRPRKASPKHWYSIAIGKSGAVLSASINSLRRIVSVELYLATSEAKQQFCKLLTQKGSIESEVGAALEWMELPEKKACRIILHLKDADIFTRDDWNRQHTWLINYLKIFTKTFSSRLKGLGIEDIIQFKSELNEPYENLI